MPVPTARIPGLTPPAPGRAAIPRPGMIRTVQLGRRKPAEAVRPIRLSRYLDRNHLSVPPPSVLRESTAAGPLSRMYLNDRLGCCVISSNAHLVGVLSGADATAGPGTAIEFPDASIGDTYQRWCGPGDNGCVIQDVLGRWQAEGFPAGSGQHHILDFIPIDPADKLGLQIAIHLFGGVKFGLEYLDSWQAHSVPDGVWDDVRGSSLGGHDVPGIGYDLDRGVRVSTWGIVLWLTWAALANRRIVEECWLPLSADWFNADNLSPAGLDVAGLKAAIAEFRAGRYPADPPNTPPAPPVPPVPPVPPTPAPGPALALTLAGSGRGWWGTETITMSGTAIPAANASGQDFTEAELEQLGVPPARRPAFREAMRARAQQQPARPEAHMSGPQPADSQGGGGLKGVDWPAVLAALLQLLAQFFPGVFGRQQGSYKAAE